MTTRVSPATALRTVAKIFAMTGLCAHFALTILYCFPNNPLKLVSQSLLAQTIGTYFAQNWSLFAPNPLQANESVVVRCLTASEAAEAAGPAGPPKDGWVDISTPLVQAHQRNRFSGYDRISRAATNSLRRWASGQGDTDEFRKECEQGLDESCKQEKAITEARQAEAVPLISRVASSYCLEDPRAATFTRVAVRGRTAGIVPWSKRNDDLPPPPPEDFDVGIFPIAADVTPSGLFAMKGEM